MTGTFVALAAAGAAGTLARFTLSGLVQRFAGGSFPWGTLVVNLTGCFLYGLLLALAERRMDLDPNIRRIVFVGFMGAFTTFSSLISDTVQMAQEGAKGLKCSAQKPFRLRARMRQIGSLGLIHGHRKQSPANRMHDDVR